MTPSSSDGFVPLAAAPAPGAGREDFRVLLAERPELARSLCQVSPSPANPSASSTNATRCEPKVTLQKEADQITGIHIECSCGQIIDLKCGY